MQLYLLFTIACLLFPSSPLGLNFWFLNLKKNSSYNAKILLKLLQLKYLNVLCPQWIFGIQSYKTFSLFDPVLCLQQIFLSSIFCLRGYSHVESCDCTYFSVMQNILSHRCHYGADIVFFMEKNPGECIHFQNC